MKSHEIFKRTQERSEHIQKKEHVPYFEVSVTQESSVTWHDLVTKGRGKKNLIS